MIDFIVGLNESIQKCYLILLNVAVTVLNIPQKYDTQMTICRSTKMPKFSVYKPQFQFSLH